MLLYLTIPFPVQKKEYTDKNVWIIDADRNQYVGWYTEALKELEQISLDNSSVYKIKDELAKYLLEEELPF